MADGVFNIPMSEYYNKSSEFKGKISELITNVENNFLNKVSENIGKLDSQDFSVVEGFASYTEAKEKLKTLKEYETKLTNMAGEGGSNPLNGVVSLDKQYSGKFSDISKGVGSQTVASAISVINRNVESEKFSREIQLLINKLGKDFTNNAIVRGLLALAKTNPMKALEKFLSDPTFQKILGENSKASSIIWSILYKFDDWSRLGNFEKVIDAIFSNQNIVNILDKAPGFIQDKFLNTLIKLSETNGWQLLDKGKKVAEWIGRIGELQPVKWMTALANTKIGKAITNPWLTLGLTALTSSVNEFTDPKSKAYHHKGKAIVGGTVDAILSIGLVEGALIGSRLGGGWGAVIGGVVGTVNTIYQWKNPNTKKDVKNWVYDRIDDLGDPTSATYMIVRSATGVSFPLLNDLFGS